MKKEYINSIKKLKKRYEDKIKIGTGYEVEYLPGEEKNIKELKDECDKIILGQHFVYDNEEILKILGKDNYTDVELIRYAEYIKKSHRVKYSRYNSTS